LAKSDLETSEVLASLVLASLVLASLRQFWLFRVVCVQVAGQVI